MKKQKNSTANLKVKIISGCWRGKNINFLEKKDLRPTKSQIRETLFNWIQYDVENSYCLDLFSGSGVLGFEAASRGAKKVFMVDNDLDVVNCLNIQKKKLKGDNIFIFNSDSIEFLKNFNEKVSLIFLDPPFTKNVLDETIKSLSVSNSLIDRCKIYIELPHNKNFTVNIKTPENWELLKSKKSGDVAYLLFQHNCSMI